MSDPLGLDVEILRLLRGHYATPGQLLGSLLDTRPTLTRAEVTAALAALESRGKVTEAYDDLWRLPEYEPKKENPDDRSDV